MTPQLRSVRDLNPEELHLLPLGIGNAFTRRFFNSSFLLIFGGQVLLVDAPAPLRRVLAEAEAASGYALDLDAIDALFLTHLHGDHCNGLEEIGFWRMFSSQHKKPRLLVHREMKEPLWHQRLYAAMGELNGAWGTKVVSLEHYFDVTEFSPGTPDNAGVEGFEIIPRMGSHVVPCAGFKAQWRGRRIGYSADTEFDPELFEFFADCHLIVHETGPGVGHTSLEDLLTLPREMQERLRLIHIPDNFDQTGSPLPALEEGQLYRV